MLKKLNANIIVALCASCAIIAFAFYERYAASAQGARRSRFTSRRP